MKRVPFRWLQRLDTLGHKLRLPRFLYRAVCDEYERRLQESFDWGFHYVAQQAALTDAQNFTSGSGSTNITFARKRHDG